ncbi:hypothetical protein [Nonomuraea sp. NPDC048916]|uniref:hypothetical protein n=1 Tax=Nonomuraea sp. NPDC048916 TaxID=3154232 RepID=UPI0033F9C87F
MALLHLVVAISVWRPGGGSPRPILYAAGFLGLTLAQIALGLPADGAASPMAAAFAALALDEVSRPTAATEIGRSRWWTVA